MPSPVTTETSYYMVLGSLYNRLSMAFHLSGPDQSFNRETKTRKSGFVGCTP